jgi:hypothetical protein
MWRDANNPEWNPDDKTFRAPTGHSRLLRQGGAVSKDPITLPTVENQIQVRFSDTDAMGHEDAS